MYTDTRVFGLETDNVDAVLLADGWHELFQFDYGASNFELVYIRTGGAEVELCAVFYDKEETEYIVPASSVFGLRRYKSDHKDVMIGLAIRELGGKIEVEDK